MTIESAATIEFFAVLAISLGLWIYFGFRWKREATPLLPKCESELHTMGLLDLFAMLTIWIVFQIAGQSLGVHWFSGGEPIADLDVIQQSKIVLMIKACSAAGFFLSLFWLMMRYRKPVTGMFTRNFRQNVRIGLLASLLLLPPILGIHTLLAWLVPYEHSTLKSIDESNASFVLLSGWITAVLIAPVCEEILCRAGIQSWIRRLKSGAEFWEFNSFLMGGPPVPPEGYVGPKETSAVGWLGIEKSAWLGIVIAAGFFAFLHVGQGLAPVPLFLMAFGLGFIFERTRSIVPCIMVHFALNAHSMFWQTLKSI